MSAFIFIHPVFPTGLIIPLSIAQRVILPGLLNAPPLPKKNHPTHVLAKGHYDYRSDRISKAGLSLLSLDLSCLRYNNHDRKWPSEQ